MQNYIIPKTASSCNIKVSTKYSDTISPSTCFLWTTFFPWASIINFLKMTGGRLFIAPMIVETDAHALIFPSIRWHRMSLPAFKQNHTTSDRWDTQWPVVLVWPPSWCNFKRALKTMMGTEWYEFPAWPYILAKEIVKFSSWKKEVRR